MSNKHMTAEERAADICRQLSEDIPIGGTDYLVILDGVRQAMRDQRHACAEAVLTIHDIQREAYSAVFNARIRPKVQL